MLSGDEHVAEYRPPANVVPIEKGKDIGEMLASGELVAAVGVEAKHPDVKPLIPNATDAGLAALKARGHYPINHLIAVKDEVLDANPELADRHFRGLRTIEEALCRSATERRDRRTQALPRS